VRIYLPISIVILLAASTTGAAERDERYLNKAEKAATNQREHIRAEIKNLKDHDWAGEYYAGDGLGVNTSLAIAPGTGYVFEWHGCVGLYDRNYGAVTKTNNRIRLSFTFENNRKGFQGIAPELIPVSWGERSYLIPADDIAGFCNNVNGGREPRMHAHGSYLLRRGDEKKEVTGFPNVPDEFRAYLLAKPIEATILAVGAYTTRPSVIDERDTPVTLDAGTNKGVRVGMEFVVTEPQLVVQSVRITKVEADRAEGIMTQFGEKERGPESGWRLSTQAPWNVGSRNKR